ncbi:MAG: type II toxin-antitoxin system VapC family toxin [Myxococcota bacterium]
MIVDTSALVAIFQREAEAVPFLEALSGAQSTSISTVTFVETATVLSYRKAKPMQATIEDFLDRLGVERVSFTDQHRIEALDAHWRYGKGRHPAALNFGDCISYATAKLAGESLLYKGRDFSRTDIEPAFVEPG